MNEVFAAQNLEIIELKRAHAIEVAELKRAHAKELAEKIAQIHGLKLQLMYKHIKIEKLQSQDQKATATDFARRDWDKIIDDERTFVCFLKGKGLATIETNADASVDELKQKIFTENAALFEGIDDADKLDLHILVEREGFTKFEEEDSIIMASTKHVRDYFPSNSVSKPKVLDIVVEVAPTFTREIPFSLERLGKELSEEEEAEEQVRYERVKEELGLFVRWSISGTDFAQRHDFPRAKWLEFSRYPDSNRARVSIGQTTTWSDLYIACNECIKLAEGEEWGSRFVEYFRQSTDELTLKLFIGT